MSQRLVCTVTSKNYLAQTRVLAHSLRTHHPDLRLVVLLADQVDGCFDPGQESFELITLNELIDKNKVWEEMASRYSQLEFCCAVRGLFHQWIRDIRQPDQWIFLDPDTLILDSLNPVFTQIEQTSIVLTPHSTRPGQGEGFIQQEKGFIKNGIFNGGFLGINNTPEADRFINWFSDRLKVECYNGCQRKGHDNEFVDQKWLNLVPYYFQDVQLCRHPGINIGHWNLWERELSLTSSGQILCNDKPLVMAHFSGWEFYKGRCTNKYTKIYDQDLSAVWQDLCVEYFALLEKSGLTQARQWNYAFETLQVLKRVRHKLGRLFLPAQEAPLN